MNIFMVVACVIFASLSIFLIAKYGVKKKEDSEYIVQDKKEY